MSLIMRIESGTHTGKALTIDAGSYIRVGRTAHADYMIGDDPFLSGVHFEGRWDGTTCALVNLNSSDGHDAWWITR